MNASAPSRTQPTPPGEDAGAAPGRPRVALVLTRAIAEDSGFGRVKTLQEIRAALISGFEVTELRIASLVETRRIGEIVSACWRWLYGLLVGRPLPLQTALYSGSSEIRRLVNSLVAGKFDAIYLDSVRCLVLLRTIRQHLPEAHVVVDLDDLMSRRMEQLALRRIPLSLGFLQHLFPKPLQWLMQGPVSGLVERYEARTLYRAEREMAQASQAVVLVSSAERDILRQRLDPGERANIHAMPPPAVERHEAPVAARTAGRFVFVGSDRLAQNRLSIDFLLELWRRLEPAAGLHIYGRQARQLPQTPGVHWHGYVEDVAEAYSNDSVMLLPCLIPGGIKTKVIEAWSFSCPVLGNALAFEGVEIPGYPLVAPENDWADYLLHPEQHSGAWSSAAALGNTFARTTLSPERYRNSWRKLVVPGAGELHTNSPTSRSEFMSHARSLSQ
jgi:glycosyltransferase involved in cell wall biosynthesis